MRAVGFTHSLPIDHADSLLDVDLPDPQVLENDLLVEVEAVSVNPADAKQRMRTAIDAPHETPLVLGYDAVGTVRAVGAAVQGFKAGERVWYAGDATRPGFYAALQCVDHRIAARAHASVSPGAADMARQGQMLARVARLVDDGLVTTTETRVLSGLSVNTTKEAHRLIETRATIGKIVVKY